MTIAAFLLQVEYLPVTYFSTSVTLANDCPKSHGDNLPWVPRVVTALSLVRLHIFSSPRLGTAYYCRLNIHGLHTIPLPRMTKIKIHRTQIETTLALGGRDYDLELVAFRVL